MNDEQGILRRLDHYADCIEKGVHVTGTQLKSLVKDIRERGLISSQQPPAEAQPVAWRSQGKSGWTFTDMPHARDIATGIWEPLYIATPPSAPVGVEDHVKALRELRDTGDVSDWRLFESALDAAIAALSAPQSGDWVLVPKDAIERAIETLENDGDEHGEGRNLRAMLDTAPQPPAEAQRCTCPSGDGSLRWPCPAHPPEAQPVGEVRLHNGLLYGRLDGDLPVGKKLYAHPPPSAPVGVEDDFNGDTSHLIRSIESLLRMDAIGALVPHGIGGHARRLLAAAANRLAQQPAASSGKAVATVSGEFSEVRQDGGVYWLQTVLLKRPQQLPFGAPLYTAPQQPASTLPDVDDDDLTVAYMAGRHDGRKEAQQHADVDGDWRKKAAEWLESKAVEQDSNNQRWPDHAAAYKEWRDRPGILRYLAIQVLAAQQGGSDNDR